MNSKIYVAVSSIYLVWLLASVRRAEVYEVLTEQVGQQLHEESQVPVLLLLGLLVHQSPTHLQNTIQYTAQGKL